jgi:hypothetical protein
MKRDMDLARRILLDLEESPDADGAGGMGIEIEGRTEQEISYHVALLHEAGLLHAIDGSADDEICWMPVRLTWDGHEFLDASREPGRWEKAKRTVLEKTGGLSFEAIKQVLFQLLRDAVTGG